MKYYVGLKNGNRTVFQASEMPTEFTHGKDFAAVIGPFRTKRGAIFMRNYGSNNPHVLSVADAERLAKKRE